MKRAIKIFVLLLVCMNMSAQPFECDGDFILSFTQQSPSSLYRLVIDPVSGSVVFDPLSTSHTGKIINAIGYRTTDNYVYGIDPNSHELYRVDASGTATYLTTLPLTHQTVYWAGDITPDGQYLILMGKINGWICTCDFVRVNLDDYSTEIMIVPNVSAAEFICTDLAFDPVSGELFGFDNLENKFFTIDPQSGVVDLTRFGPSNPIDALGAIFFDAFGNIYGYGSEVGVPISNVLFRVDKETGAVLDKAYGPETTGQDGCACSNNVELRKLVYPLEAFPCDEVTFVFQIANASRVPVVGTSFMDVMPVDFTITEIVHNPYPGNVVSGIGSNILSIENMDIVPGIDSIVVKVEIGPSAFGPYRNQASIGNLPASLGEETLSDNPSTLTIGDSTDLFIHPFSDNAGRDTVGMCASDQITLSAGVNNVSYLWDDGSTDSTRLIDQEGMYWVRISNNCLSVYDTFVVIGRSLAIDLGPDMVINLGDSVMLDPDLISFGFTSYQWTDPLMNSIACITCPQTTAYPVFDVEYTLSAIDEFGCEAEDKIRITIDVDRELYIPNAFSPNFDGINDMLFINSGGNAEVKTFKIFHRWGGLVFQQKGTSVNDSSEGWDGTCKGEPMDNGVYTYYAEIAYADGQVILVAGDVTLVR